MGRKCCMPGCKSNYGTENSYTPAFQFPKDETLRQVWIKAIKREKEFIPSKTAVVCIKHFEERCIIREDRATRDDGTVLVVPRKKLGLTSDAVPTLFPNCPQYMSKSPTRKRKSPSKRREAVAARDEENFQLWCKDDEIISFEEFTKNLTSHQSHEWKTLISSDYVLLYCLQVEDCPKIVVSLKIFQDLSVKVWHSGIEVCPSIFKHILGNEMQCNRWTKFDCLLSKLLHLDQSIEDKLANLLNALQQYSEGIEVLSSVEEKDKLQFVREQISLLRMKQIRYSPELLKWCGKFFFSYPAAYIMIRDSKVLTVPHPSYLKKLSTVISKSTNGNSHVTYLKNKATLLSENERVVNVLLDEIYITPTIDYTGGCLSGIAANSGTALQPATTMQTFMIVSAFSNYKDVVSLIPVRNLTAEKLHSYTYFRI